MGRTKQYILLFLVIAALVQAGLGGLRDMFNVSLFGMSAQHGWHDAIILLLLAILASITLR